MADKRPLANYTGSIREMATGDTVPETNGGTGNASYAVGDLLYASTTTTLTRLPAVAVGNVLRAAGVSAASAWGKVALTTDVSGVLPIANGGTGNTTNAAATAATLATARTIAITGAVTGTATSFNGSANISIPATGVDVGHAGVTGTLAVDHGGTGVTTSTGSGSVVLSNNPTLGGVPTAPTAGKSSNDTQIATTQHVKQAFVSPSGAGVLDWNDPSNRLPGAGPTLLVGTSAANGPDVLPGVNAGWYFHPFNIGYGAGNGSSNATQFAVSYGNRGDELLSRGYFQGAWTGWTRYLTHKNFGEYAPTLAGVGATGTWPINITGNAASATSAGSASSADSAATLTTARSIGLSGAATGTPTAFNGGANITIPVTALNVGHAGVTGTLAIDHGGTGATTAVAALTALDGAERSNSAFADGVSPSASLASADSRALANPTAGIGYPGGGRFRFGFLNDVSGAYADVIDLSTYNDSTGGGINSLYFGKAAQTLVHKWAAAGATAWTVKTVAYTDSSITGNAATATALQTARTIGITGAVTGTATSFSGTANISIPVTAINVAHAGISGTLAADHGGTGHATFAVGDLLYAATTTTLARLPGVAAGNVLRSAGAAAPAWGKVALATDVSGTLPVANGGTGAATAAAARTNLGVVSKAGDTMTGNLTLSTLSGNAGLTLNVSNMATDNAVIVGQNNGVNRWALELGTAGAAAFALSRFNSSGAYVDTPLRVESDTGSLSTGGSATVNGTLTVNGQLNPSERIAARGYLARTGINGGFGGNIHNWFWNGSAIEAWVDTSYLGNVSLTSDERVKHEIFPLVPDREAYLAIEPIAFHYRNIGIFRDTGEHWGFSAQNLRDCLPQAVDGNPDAVLEDGTPQPMSVQDRPILAQTVLHVQDLIRESAELRALVVDLKRRLDALATPNTGTLA